MEAPKTFNDWADYWRYTIGVNVIPADTKNKRTGISWKQYQNAPIPLETHEQWKAEDAFRDGMAVIAGKVWHNSVKKDYYLVCVDLDNLRAIDEFAINGLERLAAHVIVEQHRDDRNKAHVYFYSTKPFPKKSSDKVSPQLAQKLAADEIPAIEVKGLGEHGISYCTPSLHKNGHPYEIIGTLEPSAVDDFKQHIDNICKKYGIAYLEAANGTDRALVPVSEMFKDGFVVYEGHNRHEHLLRAMESLIARNMAILDMDSIKCMAADFNQKHCSPPLPRTEFEKQWHDAVKFIERNPPAKTAISEYKHSPANQKEAEDERKEFYIQKYTNGTLAEAIILNGLPMFLQVVEGQARVKEQIDLPDMILRPIEKPAYLNMPYAFASMDEINQYMQRASKETYDSLFQKVKAIWSKYIDGDKDHITICAADTIFTYFQDKLGITHYLMFIGDNGTGKGSNLRVFKELAYRPLFDTSITPANIYQYLGSIEEGQGIILEDEADNIDESNEKMRIYKVGYTAGTKVSRIDTSFGRKQLGFWTYCFKAFAAERSPDTVKGKGFNERTFVIQCSIGYPKYDITEVTNPAGEEKYKGLLDELIDVRKLLLIFRLMHYNDPIPDIELNITNREKQLCKPLIRLFQDSEAVNEIISTLSNLLSQKRERKGNTLEARLYEVVEQAIRENQSHVLPNAELWQRFKNRTPGTEIPNKPQSYDSEEFGLVSQKVLTGILKDKFCAQQKRDTERKIIFCQDKLERLKNVYGLPDQIEIVRGSESTHQTLPTLFQDVDTPKSEDSPHEDKQVNHDVKRENTPENMGIGPLEVSNPSEVSKFDCPVCGHNCTTVDELERHAVQRHSGKPVMAKFAKGVNKT